jgi:hypothetical protein
MTVMADSVVVAKVLCPATVKEPPIAWSLVVDALTKIAVVANRLLDVTLTRVNPEKLTFVAEKLVVVSEVKTALVPAILVNVPVVAKNVVAVALPKVTLVNDPTVAAKLVDVTEENTPFVPEKFVATKFVDVVKTDNKFDTEPELAPNVVAKKLVVVALLTNTLVPVALTHNKFEYVIGFVTTRLANVPVVA